MLTVWAGLVMGTQVLWAKEPLPAVAWSVKVEAVSGGTGTMPATVPATRPATGPADRDSIKQNLDISFPFNIAREVVVPTRPSRFVFSYDNWRDGGWELWDLHQGAKIESGKERIDLDNLMLSPDGRHIAGTRSGQPGQVGDVEVFEIKTMQRVCRVEGRPAHFPPNVVGFTAAGRVLIYHWGAGKNPVVAVHDLTTGEKKVELKSKRWGWSG